VLVDRFEVPDSPPSEVLPPEGPLLVRGRTGGEEFVVWRLPEGVGDDPTFGGRAAALGRLRLPHTIPPKEAGWASEGDCAFGLNVAQPYLLFAAQPVAATRPWSSFASELSPDERLAVAVQVLWAMRHAHEHDLLLGDLEVGALRVSRSGAGVRALVVGLGPTQEDPQEGSAAAPERASGQSTQASDLYALGHCLGAGLRGLGERSALGGADRLLATLSTNLCDPDPQQRPPSAAAALQQLLDWAPEVAAAVGGDLPEGKLVGRDAERGELLAVARSRLHPTEGSPGGAPWALVKGEPGCGRTRLLEELSGRLRLEGASVFALGSACDAEAILASAPALVTLADADEAPPDLRADVARLVRQAAAADARVFVALSLRTDTLEDELAPLRALAPPHETHLGPFEREALAELCASILRQPLPAEALDVVERWSGGNPAEARDALSRLRAADVLVPSGASDQPWHVHLDRLAGLPATLPGETAAFPPSTTRDQRKILRALATAPAGGAHAEALIQVTGLPSVAWGAASQRLLESGHVVDVEGTLRFARERARQRVLGALKKREVETLRRGHVSWLERGLPVEGTEGVSDAVLCALAELSQQLADAKRAARFVPAAAARERAAGAPLRAAERLAAWRPLLEKRPATERVAALATLGDVLLAAGRPRDADEAYAAALSTRSPKVSLLERAVLHRNRASAAFARGDVAGAAEALERARTAWERVPGGSDRVQEGLRLTGFEAQAALKAGERERVLELTLSARPRGEREEGSHEAVAESRGLTTRAWASLVNLRGLAHFHRGRPVAARTCFEQGQSLCRELGLRAGEVMLLGNLALVADYEGDPRESYRLLAESRAMALEAGFGASAGNAAGNLGNLANRGGRLEEARRHYRESLRYASARGDDEALCIGLCALGDTRLGEGDASQALPYFERALSVAQAVSVPYLQALAQVNRADALRRLGKLSQASAAVENAIELRRALDEPARLVRALTLGARLCHELGEGDEARAMLGVARTTLGEDKNQIARGEVELLHGALTTGAESAAALDAAALAFAQAGAREGLARVAWARARVALEAGDAEQAGQGAARAAVEASACGSRGLEAAARTLQAEALVLDGGTRGLAESLDHLRGARSLAHRLHLPELARSAAGAQARVHERRGEPLEAAAARLAARRAVDVVCQDLSSAQTRTYRARLDVQRDVDPKGQAKAVARPAPAAVAAPAQEAADAQGRLLDCLGATLTLLRGERGFVVRVGEGGRATAVLAARDAAGGAIELNDSERSAASEESSPSDVLVVPIRGASARLVVSRATPFEEHEAEAAAGFSVALAGHVAKRQPAPPGGRGERYGLIGRSSRLRVVVERLERFAAFVLPVLVRGESGTGKELVARALHAASPRSEGPFLAVNASGFSDSLVAAELFGAEQGSYTGAVTERAGIFELASGGTLFLDEVAEAPAKVQAMLLRVLEEGRVRRVGGSVSIEVDVRVVCASHRDLAREVREGRFRQDLYYRLCGLELLLPPLRERREDIGLLANRFLASAQSEGRGNARLGTASLRRLERHDWPGNVRELRNVIERALALAAKATIEPADLGLPAEDPAGPRGSLDTIEREAIARALAEQDTLTSAARSLGIDRRTLGRRMRRYGLSRD
jgi:DNA-binding NtrC family response regulator/tetratricopeptide (TPR) repeat protein